MPVNLGLFWKVELEYKYLSWFLAGAVGELCLYNDSCVPGVGEFCLCISVVHLQSYVTFDQVLIIQL